MGIWFLRIAMLYVVVGVLFGLVMGITERFQFADVHAHINLLGWATLALAGLIYTVFPSAGNNRLAVAHFWLHNVGLPIFIFALFILANGNKTLGVPAAIVGSNLAILGILVFAINVWLNVKPARVGT